MALECRPGEFPWWIVKSRPGPFRPGSRSRRSIVGVVKLIGSGQNLHTVPFTSEGQSTVTLVGQGKSVSAVDDDAGGGGSAGNG